MKKTIFTLVVFSLLVLPLTAFADDGEMHSGGKCDPTAGCQTPPPVGFAPTPDNAGDDSTIAETVFLYLNELFK